MSTVDELFQWEKTANFLNNNKLIENKELEKEKYYLNLRESLLKQGTKAIIFEENNNNENVSLNAENKKEMKDDGSNPKTGDNVMLYIAIVSMSIIGLGATTVAVKKNKTN